MKVSCQHQTQKEVTGHLGYQPSTFSYLKKALPQQKPFLCVAGHRPPDSCPTLCTSPPHLSVLQGRGYHQALSVMFGLLTRAKHKTQEKVMGSLEAPRRSALRVSSLVRFVLPDTLQHGETCRSKWQIASRRWSSKRMTLYFSRVTQVADQSLPCPVSRDIFNIYAA